VRRFVPAIALLALSSACGRDIGDPCTTNVDCSQNNDRDCDLSQPGGYCTQNGCDEQSCPSEAVCIRVFPYEFKTSDNVCAQDTDCTSDQLCLPDVPTGFCVPRGAERRFCAKSCGSNDDCRAGYVCHEAGIEGNQPASSTYGSIALVANANQSTVVKFCAPTPPP
jgi:hypothetical protein